MVGIHSSRCLVHRLSLAEGFSDEAELGADAWLLKWGVKLVSTLSTF